MEDDYKRRLKQYRKSTKGNQVDESSWTAFRKEEKRFKTKFPPPSLEGVLDLASLLESDPSSFSTVRRIKTKPGHSTAFVFQDIPGQ